MKPVVHQRVEYLRFWGLPFPPFIQRDPKRFFCGAAQRSVLFQVEQFIASGERVALLVGQSGCGMTRIFEYLWQLSGMGDCAVEMHLASERPTTGEKVRTVWLRDRKDSIQEHLPNNLSSDLSVLMGIEPRNQKTMFANFGKHTRVIELTNMTLEDCLLYVPYSLQAAGASRLIFTESAIARLHEYSGGRIRELSQLAENSLWASWSQNQRTIGPNLVDQLCRLQRSAA